MKIVTEFVSNSWLDMVACNVATLGEGDWNYEKMQNVEFGGFENYGNKLVAKYLTNWLMGISSLL